MCGVKQVDMEDWRVRFHWQGSSMSARLMSPPAESGELEGQVEGD